MARFECLQHGGDFFGPQFQSDVFTQPAGKVVRIAKALEGGSERAGIITLVCPRDRVLKKREQLLPFQLETI